MKLYPIWLRQDRLCFYCDGETWCLGVEGRIANAQRLGVDPNDIASLKKFQATREHLRRRADGGTHGNSRIVSACSYCNHRRGKRTPEQHRMAMQALVAAGRHPVNRKSREAA